MPTTDIREVLSNLKSAQQKPLGGFPGSTMTKSTFTEGMSQTSGLTFYDLELGAKFVYPVLTPLRNAIPRVSGKGGLAANWRSITAINTQGLRFGVSAANRGGALAVVTQDYSAAYKGLGVETSVDFEAQYAGQGFDDVRAEADRRLADDLAPAESAVDRLVMVDLTDGQFDALVSFVFNVGEGTFAKSTLLKTLNAGHYSAVPAQLQRFRYAHGRPLKGLAARRAAEAGLWARGSYVATNTAPVDPKLLGLMTPETAIAGLGTLGALAGAASSPGPLQWVLAGAIGLAMIGLALFAYRRFAEV